MSSAAGMDFEGPRVVAPRLADILGRDVPNLQLTRLRRAVARPLDPAAARAQGLAAIASHLAVIAPGDSVAIAVGSRGIRGIDLVVGGVIAAVRAQGGEPFVVPAMGSHGGADAQGQAQTLDRLGVNDSLGAPVRATMRTVDLGVIEGVRVHVDANAAAADHIVLINRLKSHTSFSGQIESGLAKMLAIGLGKQRGAEELHRCGPARLEERIVLAAKYICARLPVLGGLALIESRTKGLAAVEFVAPEGIGSVREAELLSLAKSHEARLPFERADVLVVDLMGKEYSGTGMDTNVLGRRMVRSMPELSAPSITNVVCLGISQKSGGNAVGVGLADFVPQRLLERMDPLSTYANALTAGSQAVQRAQIPIVLRDDVDAVGAAILTCDVADLDRVRLARVHDTLHLDDLFVTAPLVAEVMRHGYDVVGVTKLFGPGAVLPAW